MICMNCQQENPTESRFCLRCGEHIGQSCSHCQASLPVGAQFCNQCGKSVSDLSGYSVSSSIAALKGGEAINFPELISDLETLLIDTAMLLAGGNTARAARLLQLKRTTLISKLQSRPRK